MMFNKIIKPLTFIFYILFIACLAVFTFIERYKGTAFAKEYLYYSHWFTAIFVCLLLSAFCRATYEICTPPLSAIFSPNV